MAKKETKFCKYHCMCTHIADEFQGKQAKEKTSKHFDKKKKYTKQEANVIMEN